MISPGRLLLGRLGFARSAAAGPGVGQVLSSWSALPPNSSGSGSNSSDSPFGAARLGPQPDGKGRGRGGGLASGLGFGRSNGPGGLLGDLGSAPRFNGPSQGPRPSQPQQGGKSSSGKGDDAGGGISIKSNNGKGGDMGSAPLGEQGAKPRQPQGNQGQGSMFSTPRSEQGLRPQPMPSQPQVNQGQGSMFSTPRSEQGLRPQPMPSQPQGNQGQGRMFSTPRSEQGSRPQPMSSQPQGIQGLGSMFSTPRSEQGLRPQPMPSQPQGNQGLGSMFSTPRSEQGSRPQPMPSQPQVNQGQGGKGLGKGISGNNNNGGNSKSNGKGGNSNINGKGFNNGKGGGRGNFNGGGGQRGGGLGGPGRGPIAAGPTLSDVNPFGNANPFENPFAPPVDLWPEDAHEDLREGADDESGLDPYRNRQARGVARPGGMGRFKGSADGMAQENDRGGKGAWQSGKGKGGRSDKKAPAAPPVEVEKKVSLPAGRKVKVTQLAALARLKRGDLAVRFESMLGLADLDGDDATVEADDAELLLLEMGYAVSRGGATTEELLSLLDAEGATKGAGIDAAMAAAASRRDAAALAAADLRHLPRRAPVVCVMGHVDAGKTTLMDALRNDARAFVMNGDGKAGKDAEDDKDAVNEAAGEAGGITQRVAAFHVPTAGRSEGGAGFMTVIDTPGHAAFSGMRASGVCATDVVVVVVAAESGIQPQTEEVLKMARASNCAVVVAVTKLDRLSANERKKALERAATELLEHGWVVEAMGGEVPLVPCSGKTREGLGDLKDVVALQAELLDLRAASEGAAEATVLEASTLKGHGVVVDCLVSSGLLQVGDYVVVGKEYGKVRKLMDPSDSSAVVQSAGPSMAVRVVGLKGLPQAGSRLAVCRDESTARQLAKLREDQFAMQRLRDTAEHVDDTEHSAISARTGQLSRFAIKKQKIKVMRERALMAKTGQFDFDPGVPRQTVAVAARNSLLATEAALAAARLAVVEEGVPFPVVVKVDSFGSVAAVMELIAGLPDDKVCVQMVHIEVGPVTTGDVELAIAAAEREGVKLKAAPIFAFNVGSNGGDVTTAAKRAKVQIRKHKVIYSLIDDLRELLTAAIPVKVEESIEGRAHVKQVFEIKKKGVGKVVVAGCAVDTGRLLATGSFRVIRNGTVLHSTESGMSLQHHQSEVPEVKHGIECGVGFSSFSGLAAGDVVECFVRKEIKQVL